MQVYYFYKTI